jgi:tetratricopeptide (TPR) repeat protein
MIAAILEIAAVILAKLPLPRFKRRQTGAPARSPSVSAPPPPSDEYVPRQEKENEAAQHLLDRRSACVFGEPGIGKSSLAMSVAARPDVRQQFPDDVWWVDAAGMGLRAMCEAVASPLGPAALAGAKTDEQRLGALRTAIGERKVLVVLDNCEDPDASARFAEKAHRATLVTSQHRPRGPQPVELGRMTDEECLKILHLNAHRPLRADEADAAREIVSLLAGHPFAVALAGSQIEDASAQEVLGALRGSPWAVLTDRRRRKRAVKASLDAAYKRLSDDGRRLFCSLGVFGGPSFDLDAVQAVEPSANPARMDQLVRRSLVRQEEGRYALHPLVRRYARDRLGEKREPYLKIAEHYLDLAESLGGDPSNFRRLDTEVGNALAAMDWCLEAEQWERVARFALALNNYLDYRGLWGVRRQRLEQARQAAQHTRNSRLLAVCSHNLGIAAQQQGDYDEARRLYQESLDIFEQLGDRPHTGGTKHQLGMLAHDQGDYPEARRLYQESLAIFEGLHDLPRMAATKHQLGMLAHDQGDYPEARRLYQESLAIKEELRDRLGIAQSKHQLGMLAQLAGDYAEARRLYQESLDIEEQLGNRSGIATSKHQLGRLAELDGDIPAARALYQGALAILEALGSPEAEKPRRGLERLASEKPKEKPRKKR